MQRSDDEEWEMGEIEKVIRDGKVAVLVSPSYGAGWSSWVSDEFKNIALFHPKFVEWVEGGKKGDLQEIVKSLVGDSYFCSLGGDDLEIQWLPVGAQFTVDDYDGSESLTFRDSDNWVAA